MDYKGWFVVREKYCSGWKNKLKSTDYKSDEQVSCLLPVFVPATKGSNILLGSVLCTVTFPVW
jgi:hypothetical protein